ncbi:MAG: flagellar export chaperone FliS [Deltaproteobacteria bacterium]|nr:flagellar export chaperone FliS [Deltaproteobacteria bacterium]
MSFAVGQYQATTVETASPAQLVVVLYDGALRFLRQAAAAAEGGEIAKRGMALGRAHAIVTELQATLQPEHAPELCAQLDGLYGFVLEKITEANLKGDPAPLVPAVKVLEQLREAWAQVAKETR